jgi:hypothetical protein
VSSRIPRVGKGGSQKDDANCEHTHGQYHLLCFQCNPKETMCLCSTKSPPCRDSQSLFFELYPDALVHCKQECHDTDHSHSLVTLHLIWLRESYRFTVHHLVLPASAIGPKKEDMQRSHLTNDTRVRSHGFGTN